MSSMKDVPARWEGINGGPFLDANDLLAFLVSNSSTFNSNTLRDWMAHVRGIRLDQVAEVFADADVPAMKKDLLALRDELADET